MQPDWEIWIDSNISPIIAKWMVDEYGLKAKSAYSLELNKLTDEQIYRRAKDYGKVILISKDADFPALISRLGAPPKLVNIKTGNCDNRKLWEKLKGKIVQITEVLTRTDIDIINFEY